MAQGTLTFLLLNTASAASCFSHRNGDPIRKGRLHSPFLGKSLSVSSLRAVCRQRKIVEQQRRQSLRGSGIAFAEQASELEPLDLTEENIELVLLEARSEVHLEKSSAPGNVIPQNECTRNQDWIKSGCNSSHLSQ